MTDRQTQTTHAPGCWDCGPRHYECAVREIEALRADLKESDEIREKLGHLLTRTAAALKGDPPAGVWHSWHDLPEKAAQLVERVQRDEALLRQALAAPDLLEALQEIVSAADGGGWSQLDATFSKARAAIAKATGQKVGKVRQIVNAAWHRGFADHAAAQRAGEEAVRKMK